MKLETWRLNGRRCGDNGGNRWGLVAVFAGVLAMGLGFSEVRAQGTNQPLDMPFPRLGMWWPEPESQPLEEIARYDYVMLFNRQEEFLKPIKAINPNILLLNSTNACELSYLADEDELHIIKGLPGEWFLTQVGSELVESVDATTTTFRVANLSVTDGEDSIRLFVPNDTVLIDGESVRVKSIDRATNTLEVERGFVRPASAHKKGTRVAAHITFWPGSWLMNLSDQSAEVTLDPAIGPERWGNFNARRDAKLLSNPLWDGLTIDRADPNQSWLVGGSTARSIDPDQSNRLLDDYSDFDTSWNRGLREYQRQLRERVGDKIIYVNWGMANFDLLNGNNYEGFPLANGWSYQGDWRQTVAGSPGQIGGYLEWMEKGRHPNLSTVQTYEDDGAPPPDDDTYDNPFAHAGFVPNYQKMRFGLGTALLGDGLFSYEINTNGHGTLGLMWFDEYDNAGAGRGYLGNPTAPAFRVDEIELGKNLALGGGFGSQKELDRWEVRNEAGCSSRVGLETTAGSTALPSTSARIDVTLADGESWKSSFSYGPLVLKKGDQYTLVFRARSDRPRKMLVWTQQDVAPWENCFETPDVFLSESWQDVEVSVTSDIDAQDARLYFGLGNETGAVWIDNVSLQTGGREVWRRDFEGGTVVVNATRQPCKISLGETFRKIKGGQVPRVNDGRLVDQVALPGLDALILLRHKK